MGVRDSEFSCDFHRREEKIKGHGTVLLVLRGTERFACFQQLCDYLRLRSGALKLSFLFAFPLGSGQLLKALVRLVLLQVEVHEGKPELVNVKAEFLFDLV